MEHLSARTYRCGVLTLSDKGSRGEREDTSGPLLQEMLRARGFKSPWPGLFPINNR